MEKYITIIGLNTKDIHWNIMLRLKNYLKGNIFSAIEVRDTYIISISQRAFKRKKKFLFPPTSLNSYQNIFGIYVKSATRIRKNGGGEARFSWKIYTPDGSLPTRKL